MSCREQGPLRVLVAGRADDMFLGVVGTVVRRFRIRCNKVCPWGKESLFIFDVGCRCCVAAHLAAMKLSS